MSSGNHLTIRDYFDRLNESRNRIRKDSSLRGAESDGNTLFKQIFKSVRAARLKKTEPKSTGLTAADYLANPFRAENSHKKILPATSPHPQITAKKVGRSSDQATGSGIQTPIGRTTAPFRQNNGELRTLFPSDSRSSQRIVGSPAQAKIESSIQKAAEKYNLPPGLIKAVIKAESNFQVDAVSNAGAQGLMQLMPATAKELGVKNPFDIEQNIDGGVRYLRKMLDSFGGNVKLALAAYNAGPAALEKYGGEIPPYEETNRYVNRVLRFSKQMV
jgi:hypothetical protein